MSSSNTSKRRTKGGRRRQRSRRAAPVGPNGKRLSKGEIQAERHRVAALQRQLSIQQQISVLRWRKSQASAKMRNILTSSRQQRAQDKADTRRKDGLAAERSQWMYSVVESEMQRPLEVDDNFIQRYTQDARRDYERLERDTRHHIDVVTKLKKDLLQKEDNRRRWITYKAKREAHGLTPGPLDDGDGRAVTPGKVEAGNSEIDPLTMLIQQKATPSSIVERLEDLDALEKHLQGVRREWADKEPKFLESPATDLFLLRVPQALAMSSSVPGIGTDGVSSTGGGSTTSLL